MKTKKKIKLAIVVIVSIIVANGFYYVFKGQFKSAEKVMKGGDLNLYEVFSTYTMHLAICTIGPIYSPEAACEIFGMSFPWNRNRTIVRNDSFFINNEYVRSHIDRLNGRKRIAFKDSAYSITNKNHRVALAANPGYLYKDSEYVYFEVPCHYPKCVTTHIGISDTKCIVMNECLFTYLEEHNILHPYTVIYKAQLDRL